MTSHTEPDFATPLMRHVETDSDTDASTGTTYAKSIRTCCNKLSRDERGRLFTKGMSMITGNPDLDRDESGRFCPAISKIKQNIAQNPNRIPQNLLTRSHFSGCYSDEEIDGMIANRGER